jgi:hypothetical protein
MLHACLAVFEQGGNFALPEEALDPVSSLLGFYEGTYLVHSPGEHQQSNVA